MLNLVFNFCTPCVGDRATILPYILIGAAVVLVAGFAIFQMVRKKDDDVYETDESDENDTQE